MAARHERVSLRLSFLPICYSREQQGRRFFHCTDRSILEEIDSLECQMKNVRTVMGDVSCGDADDHTDSEESQGSGKE